MLTISPINLIKNVYDNLIQSYLLAIDNKNKKELEILYNKNKKNNIEKDIVYEIYNSNELNSERLLFIIENCSSYLDISSYLIKTLMKDNNKELLEIIFNNHLKCFDNAFIIKLLIHYKNRIPISISYFYTLLIMINIKYQLN